MFSFLSFGIEMIVCFVLLDFALGLQRWAFVGTVFAGILMLTYNTANRKKAQKQGAYGKIQVFQEPMVKQLFFHPSEVIAMFRCKFWFPSSKKESGLDFGLEDLNLSESEVEFCAVKLKQVSRSFAQVITFLPNTPQAPLRLAVAIFYLVLRALDTVEDDMDLSRFDNYVLSVDKKGVQDARLAAKQRLLRDFAKRLHDAINNNNNNNSGEQHQELHGFGESHEKELVENIEILVRVMRALPKKIQTVILAITEEMGIGMADYIARDLKNGTRDQQDFENYCHIAAGTVGDGLTRLFVACNYSPPDLVLRKDLWDSMGTFLQRTNIIRDYLEDLVDGRAWWPKSVWGKYVSDSADSSSPSSGLAALATPESIENGTSLKCLDHMIGDALQFIPKCLEYLDALGEPSVVSFCALPQVMAIATLAECYANPKLFQGVVKIRKGTAASIMLDLAPHERSGKQIHLNTLKWFVHFIKIIQYKSKLTQSARVHGLCEKIQNVVAQYQKKAMSRRSP